MGRQIVYCDGCGKLLKEEDFGKGRAHVSENRSFCVECRPLPEGAPKPPSSMANRAPSSARLAAQPNTTSRSLPKISPGSSTRFHPVPERPAASKSKAPVLVGGGIALVVVVVVLLLLASGGRREELAGPSAAAAPPAPVEAAPTPPPPPSPPPSGLEAAAKRAYAEAIEFRRSNEKDLGGQLERFRKIAEAYPGTSVAQEALRETARIRGAIRDDVAAVDRQARAFAQAEEYGKAIALVERESIRYGTEEWTGSMGDLAVRLRAEAGRTYAQFKAAAVQARRRNDAEQVKIWSQRVDRLGIAEHATDLALELSRVVPEKEPPAPPLPPSVSPALEAYRAGWRAAMALAAARDAAGAAAALGKLAAEEPVKAEREADLAMLKALGELHAEAPAILSKTPKGQKVAIEYWDPAGNPARVEDAVVRIDAHRIEVKRGEGSSVTVPYGEVRARTLAQAWLARPGRKPEDAKAAAVACALEGDLEGPAAIGAGGLDQRFSVRASEPAPPEAAAREAEARALFWRAEGGWHDPSRTQEAADAYKALLSAHAGTALVGRNRAAIAGRAEVPKEFFYLPADFGVAGGFRQGRSKKVESCWTSEKDLDEAQRRTNFVEVSFPALPGSSYRAWFYVGGCCQEVFTCFAQGTEMTGPDPKNPRQSVPAEPGAEADAPVKFYISSLKKRHQDHLGPKEPDRWEWIQVPLPKYAAAGTKHLRLLTDQKGFSVAYAVVSAARSGSPSDREIAAQEKLRAETPGFESRGMPSAGLILREWWTGIGGGGIGELTGAPGFPDQPAGFELVGAFESPRDWADNYGTRMRGYVIPPASGEYVFWICTDDDGQLFLSTDDSPANKRQIAGLTSWADWDEWEKHGSQKSAPVKLEAGRRYYIEALQKEGGGGDHLRVGWRLPDGTMERPIPGGRLAPCAPPRK